MSDITVQQEAVSTAVRRALQGAGPPAELRNGSQGEMFGNLSPSATGKGGHANGVGF